MIISAIAMLSRAGLLVENKRQNLDSPVLFVDPVVQSFMQQNDQEQCPRIPEEIRKQIQSSCCQYVLDHACHVNDSTFSVKSKALAAEDTNIQSILFSLPTSQHTVLFESTMEVLIAFSWHRCDTKPSLEIVNHAVTASKAFGVERYIALAVWCLGKTYSNLSNHHMSYNHLQEAYQVFDTLPPGEIKLQLLSGQCGVDLVNVACMSLQDKGKAVSLAWEVEVKCAALSDDLIHGQSLRILGTALNEDQQWQEALVHLDCARAMLKAVGNTPGLAFTCQVIAHVHYMEQRLP